MKTAAQRSSNQRRIKGYEEESGGRKNAKREKEMEGNSRRQEKENVIQEMRAITDW